MATCMDYPSLNQQRLSFANHTVHRNPSGMPPRLNARGYLRGSLVEEEELRSPQEDRREVHRLVVLALENEQRVVVADEVLPRPDEASSKGVKPSPIKLSTAPGDDEGSDRRTGVVEAWRPSS